MFSIKYVPKCSKFPLGQIKAQVHKEAGWLYPKDRFEFVVYSTPFGISETEHVKFRTKLSPGMWGTWDPLERNVRAVIRNDMGFVYAEFKLDPKIHRDSSDQFFSHWVNKNRGAKGIVIGTHDGTAGEWVNPVIEGSVSAILVEGSEKAFKELEKNYKVFTNIKCLNNIVDTHSREVTFYEFSGGEANTLSLSHMKSHIHNDELRTTITQSISLNDLIIKEGLQSDLKWLHLDVENLDDELIMSLNFDLVNKPELIIFESINFSEERLGNPDRFNNLLKWFTYNGYSVVYDFWNSFAYLNPK